MELYDLKTLHMVNPLGIDQIPYFSWKMKSDEQNTMQKGYELYVKNDEGELIYDSGYIESEADSFVVYEGKPLKSRTGYTWTIAVKDNHGNEDKAEAYFETAFLSRNDWQAKWTTSPFPKIRRKRGFGNQAPATLFRKIFAIEGKVKKARLYATCHGTYEADINGIRIDDRKFAPENSSYEWLLYYQTYDVTAFLKEGENNLDITVGDGWYCGVGTQPKFKGFEPLHAVLFQMEIEYADGRRQTVISDSDMKASQGPILSSDLFQGEKYDARIMPDYKDSVLIKEYGYDNLYAQLGEPVRCVEELKCKEVLHNANGETLLDFGRVVSGTVRMRLNVPCGTAVKLEHSEVVDKNGNFKMNILAGNADQIVEVISNGEVMDYEAHFSFQGFRYVRVTGMDDIRAEDFTARLYSSVKENNGTFETSDPRINQLYANTRSSQTANMLSIPTDCPQREKAGWAGDIQVYAETSLLNEDTTNLLSRWLKSLGFEQKENGAVPMIVPMHGVYYPAFGLMGRIFGNEGGIGASAGWSDAAVLVPWQMYQVTGNTVILREQYDSMKKWCNYVIRAAKTKHQRGTGIPREKEEFLWNSGYHWGEWLIPSMSRNGYGLETVRSVLETRKYTAPVFAYYTISSMAEISRILNETDDCEYYCFVAGRIRDAFGAWIAAHNGKMPIELQGAYLLPLYFDLVPEKYIRTFESKLISLIEKNNYCLDTGFLATPFLFDTLCKIGQRDVAYRVFFGEQAPSYFNQLAQGATTIWESWFSYDEEGEPLNVSLNHYAFGCVDEWMFRNFAGIDKLQPGFKEILIAPQFDESLTYVRRSFESEHGTIVSDWTRENGVFTLHVEIPCNTSARIIMPNGDIYQTGSGRYTYICEY